MEKFAYKMMVSGYNGKERGQIVKEGVARYKNIIMEADKGTRPIYRSAQWNRGKRAIVKLRSKKDWYGKTNDAVMFVQATPGEILKNEMEKVVKGHGMKIKIVEKGGMTLKNKLQRSDVEPEDSCGRECVICNTEGRRCQEESVGYKVVCMECEEVGKKVEMHGETGRSARVRCNEHQRALMKRKNSNLWEHCTEVHDGRMVQFKYRVTGVFRGDPLARQLDEAIRIEEVAKCEGAKSLNDKREWVRPAGVEISVARM